MPCSTGLLWASFNDVEHPCQQCGTSVEDGRPFCPQCRAPQIHVQIAVADAGNAAALNPSADAGFLAGYQSEDSGFPVARSRSEMDSGTAVRAVLKAGLLGVFIGAVPVIGIVLTGALAVF